MFLLQTVGSSLKQLTKQYMQPQQHPSEKHQIGQGELAQLEQPLFQHALHQKEEHTPVYHELSYRFTMYHVYYELVLRRKQNHIKDIIKIGALSSNH